MSALHPATEWSQLISVPKAAEQLDVSTRTVRRRIKDGTLRAYRVGHLIKIDPADLNRFARPVEAGEGEAA